MVVSATLVTNALICETFKQIQATQARHRDDLREIKERLRRIGRIVGVLAD